MKMKKIPQRTCVGCGTVKSKKELIRIVRCPDGTIQLDRTGKKAGRGAYVCDDPACISKAFANKGLEKALQVPVSAAVRDALLLELAHHENG
jgi:predicted RNA-binding protein YlxR (DUF448 family)